MDPPYRGGIIVGSDELLIQLTISLAVPLARLDSAPFTGVFVRVKYERDQLRFDDPS